MHAAKVPMAAPSLSAKVAPPRLSNDLGAGARCPPTIEVADEEALRTITVVSVLVSQAFPSAKVWCSAEGAVVVRRSVDRVSCAEWLMLVGIRAKAIWERRMVLPFVPSTLRIAMCGYDAPGLPASPDMPKGCAQQALVVMATLGR
jgi:hypothetical protein